MPLEGLPSPGSRFLEVEASAERATRAVDHDDPSLGALRQSGEVIAQFADHLRIERIEPMGSIQCQPGCPSVVADLDCLVVHGFLSCCRSCVEVVSKWRGRLQNGNGLKRLNNYNDYNNYNEIRVALRAAAISSATAAWQVNKNTWRLGEISPSTR
jgi:hypothetical protein